MKGLPAAQDILHLLHPRGRYLHSQRLRPWVITWSGRLGLGSPDHMYFDLLGCSSPRSEGRITWSARGAGSPSFDSDRPAPSDFAPPVSPNSGEPGMVIAWSPELSSAAG